MKLMTIAAIVGVVILALFWLRRSRCPNCGRFALQPTGYYREFWGGSKFSKLKSHEFRCRHCGEGSWQEDRPED